MELWTGALFWWKCHWADLKSAGLFLGISSWTPLKPQLEKQGRTHKWCTLMDPHTWPCKSRTTSTNIHSAVRIWDVVLKTYLGRWTIGRSGERGSGISVLPAQYDDDANFKCLYKKVCKLIECITHTHTHTHKRRNYRKWNWHVLL